MGALSGQRAQYVRVHAAMRLAGKIGLHPSLQHHAAAAAVAGLADREELDVAAEAVAHYIASACDLSTARAVLCTADFPNANTAPALAVQCTHETIEFDLSLVRGCAVPQPGNRGAGNVLAECLGLTALQEEFNAGVEEFRTTFLRDVLTADVPAAPESSPQVLRRQVREAGIRFGENGSADEARRRFLFRCRELLVQLLRAVADAHPDLLRTRYLTLMRRFPERVWLICSVDAGGAQVREERLPRAGVGQPNVNRRSNDTVELAFDNIRVRLRLKLESQPASALKFAVSYALPGDQPISEQMRLRKAGAGELLQRLARLPGGKDRIAKAPGDTVGKCFEYLTALRFIAATGAEDLSEGEAEAVLRRFAPAVPITLWRRLDGAATVAADTLLEHLRISGIESVAGVQPHNQAYVDDPLDTRDLIITARDGESRAAEFGFSLKAVARPGARIGVKNPGAGTLLGPTYFDLVPEEEMKQFLERLREEFDADDFPPAPNELRRYGTAAHAWTIVHFVDAVFTVLVQAEQPSLFRGMRALLGEWPILMGAYGTARPQATIIPPPRLDADLQEIRVERVRPYAIALHAAGVSMEIRGKFESRTSVPGRWSSLKLMVDLVPAGGR